MRLGLLAGFSAAAVVFGLVWARPEFRRGTLEPPRLSLHPTEILADGYDSATLEIESRRGGTPRITVENPHSASVEAVTGGGGKWQAQIRAGVLPGRIAVHVEVEGLPPAAAAMTATLSDSDHFEDGTPDFLRLDDEADRVAFRRWFTWLAEAQYFQTANRPAEINDCAALIRYAYREALRAHDSGWAQESRLPVVPAFHSVAKYQYPYSPLGAALFRVTDGPFRVSDLTQTAQGSQASQTPQAGIRLRTDKLPEPLSAFAQFADARSLWRFNTWLVSRDVSRALPGDLLFYRQESDRMPYHSMIWLGPSQLRPDGNAYVIYHTGPDGGLPGEMRRLAAQELLQYPKGEWRPLPSNPRFLGVYRWNILRNVSEDDDARHH